MKKILCIVVLSLLWCNTSNAGKYGEGELQLTKQVVDYFITHIRGKGAKHPSDFYVIRILLLDNSSTYVSYTRRILYV